MLNTSSNFNASTQLQKQLDTADHDLSRMNQTHTLTADIISACHQPLPPGWERVVDPHHGPYYIDHNTKRTQYEQPYEVELVKSTMGFGFTLVQTDSGLLLVRNLIAGGPAHLNGSIRPGDVLISALGESVLELDHTDIARLFSTFAVGDRVRLTFSRTNYVLDDNLIPDEYLFSNGSDGKTALAVNRFNNQSESDYVSHINYNQTFEQPVALEPDFDYVTVKLKRGEQGFGFTISDTSSGQKVKRIQNHQLCSDLEQGDVIITLNGKSIMHLTHKEVVENLKSCRSGDDVTLMVKRKKRNRLQSPLVAQNNRENNKTASPLDTLNESNCEMPTLEALSLNGPSETSRDNEHLLNLSQLTAVKENRNVGLTSNLMPNESNYTSESNFPPNIETLFKQQQTNPSNVTQFPDLYSPENHFYTLNTVMGYGAQPLYSNQPDLMGPPNPSKQIDGKAINDFESVAIASYGLVPTQTPNHAAINSISIHDPETTQTHQIDPIGSTISTGPECQEIEYADYIRHQQAYQQHMSPLYSNSEIFNESNSRTDDFQPPLLMDPTYQNSNTQSYDNDYEQNFYRNIKDGVVGYKQISASNGIASEPDNAACSIFMRPTHDQFSGVQPPFEYDNSQHSFGLLNEDEHEYEYHHVELWRNNTESNWGIRLIGGAEVDRAISIGSMTHEGVAARSGMLKSGDEIISVDRMNVVGATHQHVVEMISACKNRVLLVVKRKKYVEACDIVLTKNVDEGFGFVIISSENCALIGKIIENSPADRCKQLRVRDCIVAVNGHPITSEMKHPELVNMIKESGSTLRLRIIPVDCYTVQLIKDVQNESYGFRMRGGSEYDGTPLYIVRVEVNGQAYGLLNVGDQILEINNIPTVGMTHSQAAAIIRYSDTTVKLKLRRNYVTPPILLVDSPRALQKYSVETAEMKAVSRSLEGYRDSFNENRDGTIHRSLESFSSLPPDVRGDAQVQSAIQENKGIVVHQDVLDNPASD